MAYQVFAEFTDPQIIACQTLAWGFYLWTDYYRVSGVTKYNKFYTDTPPDWSYNYYIVVSKNSRYVLQYFYKDNLNWDTEYTLQKKFIWRTSEKIIGPSTLKTRVPDVETLYAHNITSNSAYLYGKITTPSTINYKYRVRYINTTTMTEKLTGWNINHTLHSGSIIKLYPVTSLSPGTIYKYRFEIKKGLDTPPIVYGGWKTFKTAIRTWEYRAFATLPDNTEIFGDWKEFDRPF